MFGQKGSGAACEVPQTVSDFSCCKGKQIAAAGVFYSLSFFGVQLSVSLPSMLQENRKGHQGPFCKAMS